MDQGAILSPSPYRSIFADKKALYLLTFIFCIGVLLRFFYVQATPYDLRSHDAPQHLEYIDFMATHPWQLPHAYACWECYQPPLYYFLTGRIMAWLNSSGVERANAIELLKWGSFGLSVLTLLFALLIGLELFDSKIATQRTGLWLYSLIISCFPGLIYISSRVSNDALIQTLSFAALWSILFWFRTQTLRSWILLSLFISLAILTKGNGMVLLLFVLAFLVIQKKPDLKQFGLGTILVSLCTLFSGWYFYHRYYIDKVPGVFSQVEMLYKTTLVVPRDLQTMLTFNPLKLLSIVFNDPFNDLSRRQYFWEFLFRSAHFGEWTWTTTVKPLGAIILLGGLLLMLFGMNGLYQERWKLSGNAALMKLTLITYITSIVWYATRYPFVPCQDFRFITPLTIPVAYFITSGIINSRRLWRRVGVVIALQYVGTTILFFLKLFKTV